MRPSGVSLQTIVPTGEKWASQSSPGAGLSLQNTSVAENLFEQTDVWNHVPTSWLFLFHGKMCVGGSEVMKRAEKSNCFYICRGQIFHIGSMLWEAVEQKTADPLLILWNKTNLFCYSPLSCRKPTQIRAPAFFTRAAPTNILNFARAGWQRHTACSTNCPPWKTAWPHFAAVQLTVF